MNRKRIIFCFIIMAAFLLTACSTSAAGIKESENIYSDFEIPGDVIFKGVVHDKSSGKGIEDVVVTVSNHPGIAYTDENGRFEIKEGIALEGYGEWYYNPNAAVLNFNHDLYKFSSVTAAENDFALSVRLKADKSYYPFDVSVIRRYDFTVEEDDWKWLNDNAAKEKYIPADFIHENENYGKVGLRFKGSEYSMGVECDSSGKKIVPKMSLKVKFDKYNDLKFYGLEKLNLHAMNTDYTYIHDMISYFMYRRMGVPAPRSMYCTVYINGEFEGLFVAVEQIDEDFVSSRFSDGTGNLYKEVWPVNTDEDFYTKGLKTNDGKNADVSDIVNFNNSILAIDSKKSFLREIGKNIDIYHMMRYMAVDRAIVNADGIIAWYIHDIGFLNHNYYWYHNNSEDRFYLVPWDMNETFLRPGFTVEMAWMPYWYAEVDPSREISGEIRHPSKDPLFSLLGQYALPLFRYYGDMLLGGLFTEDLLRTKTTKWGEMISSYVSKDRKGHSRGEWKSAFDNFQFHISYYIRRFQEILYSADYKKNGLLSQKVLSSYNGLDTGINNNFEGLSKAEAVSVYPYGSLTVSINEKDPLSGRSDLFASGTIRSVDNYFFSVITFKLKEQGSDLRKYKYIEFDISVSQSVWFSLEIGSSLYKRDYPFISRSFNLNPGLQTVRIPIVYFTYPEWDFQNIEPDVILASADALNFSFGLDEDASKKLSVQIDNIQFLE